MASEKPKKKKKVVIVAAKKVRNSAEPNAASYATNVEMWPIDDLKSHPLQDVYFSPLSDPELKALIDDISSDRMRDPIEILPSGVILSGHQRWRAARRLNWTVVPCNVRLDLASQGEAAIEQYLIKANAIRRQLSKLQQARIYVRLRELEPRGAERRGDGELRDVLGKRFGMTGRNLDRYVELLGYPQELQDAVETGKLPHVRALMLMKLPAQQYEPVLENLRSGHNVRDQVGKLLSFVDKQAPVTEETKKRLLRDFVCVARKLEPHLEAVGALIDPKQRNGRLAAGRLSIGLLAAQRVSTALLEPLAVKEKQHRSPDAA